MLKKSVLCVFLISNSFLQSQEDTHSSNMNLSFDVIEDIKLFHSPPEPLFIGRPFELSLVTEIDESLLSSVLLLIPRFLVLFASYLFRVSVYNYREYIGYSL